jgi:hypothetical protein
MIPRKLKLAFSLISRPVTVNGKKASKIDRIRAIVRMILGPRRRFATLSKEERVIAHRIYPDLPNYAAELKYAKWYRKWDA